MKPVRTTLAALAASLALVACVAPPSARSSGAPDPSSPLVFTFVLGRVLVVHESPPEEETSADAAGTAPVCSVSECELVRPEARTAPAPAASLAREER